MVLYKTINVNKSTWSSLRRLQVDKELSSLNDTILYLLGGHR